MKKGSHYTPVIRNKKATFEYEILEKFDAGLVLKGTEVKSLRHGRASLAEAYGRLKGGELYLEHFHIAPYEAGSWSNWDPLRPKKLLLHKPEIRRIMGRVSEKGYTLIPLRVHFKRGYAKVEIALARGKKLPDRRDAIKEREAQREMARLSKRRKL